MAREATWRNVGTSVDACKDYHAVLQEAGLDYRVVKKPGRKITRTSPQEETETYLYMGI